MAAVTDDDEGVISAINVTPLVDVTLVLLVILMVTAPIIARQGMAMDLPKTASGEAIQSVFGVEMTKNGGIFVDSEAVASDAALEALAKAAKSKNKDIRATIRADKSVSHGQVMRILDLLNQSGISKIAFAVAPKSATEISATRDAKDAGAPSPDDGETDTRTEPSEPRP